MQWRYLLTCYTIEAEVNGLHYADDIFNFISLYDSDYDVIQISLKSGYSPMMDY